MENLNLTLANDTKIFQCYDVVTDGVNGPTMVDKIILMCIYGITACFITILNAYMFNILRKKDRKRANVQFMILTISDLTNGAISMPIVMLKFIDFGDSVNCKIRAFVQFAYLFPLIYSWLITVGISIDRLVVVLMPRLHEDIVGRLNLLYRVVCLLFCLGGSISTAYFYWEEGTKPISFSESNKRASAEFSAPQFSGEIVVVFAICVLQLVLIINVNRKANVIKESRQGANSYNRKVTNTVSLLILFTVISTIPRLVIHGLELFNRSMADKRSRAGYYVVHASVLSIHLNSLFSAVILLLRTSTFKSANAMKLSK